MKYLLIFLLFGFNLFAHAQKGNFVINTQASPLIFKDIDGVEVNLEKYKGKVIVLNFWNIGCTGCEEERADLNKIYHRTKNDKLVFLSVTMNKEEKIKDWLGKHPIDYPILGNVDFLGMKGNEFFQIQCMPTTIVIDKENRVVYNQCKTIFEKENGPAFEKLLSESLSK
ncbi:TlpA family protein disulfide reductase [Rhodocytophaga rosea]|uniref:TlpA family protein disulfide reductase n=1 Tax=Rhodocytophaga rosea TaxID=2704465 RepID=A0A6C0GQQ4_9BACT|nr:TlpA disulfide reductase family protein [Rhodocytophaga rosea]QHT70415.1 TlpA family protein disulfide reductase [Rhodocytophaga rosea]